MTGQHVVLPADEKLGSHAGQRLIAAKEPLIGPPLAPGQPVFDQVARTARDITDMIPV
jgi:hypothetical protein